MSKRVVRKGIFTLAAALLVLAAAGCGEVDTPEPTIRSDTPVSAPSPVPTVSKAEAAPLFSLPASDGQTVELSQVLQANDAVVVVFYRGFF